jgi:hypothetical protein
LIRGGGVYGGGFFEEGECVIDNDFIFKAE